MMTAAKLWTATGGLVAEVVHPQFVKPPDFLIWGARVFVRTYPTLNFSDEPKEIRYVEGFGVAVFTRGQLEGLHGQATVPVGIFSPEVEPPAPDGPTVGDVVNGGQ